VIEIMMGTQDTPESVVSSKEYLATETNRMTSHERLLLLLLKEVGREALKGTHLLVIWNQQTQTERKKERA
jgi:hypothetical protein